MRPINNKQSPATVPLSDHDDKRLEEMKSRVSRIFDTAGNGHTYEAIGAQASAAAAFAAICAEQRERAVLRASLAPSTAPKTKIKSPK